MKIAQMSDLHYCAKNLVESDRCFGAAITEAIAVGVDAAIISGDSTDHAMDAHAPAVIALARQLKRLEDHCPVLMLQGTFSHEPPGLLRMFELIGAKHPITIADRVGSFGLADDCFEVLVSGKAYRMVVTALPTLNKADIAALTAQSVGDAGNKAGQLISSIIEAFAAGNRMLHKQGIPTVLVSHGTVLNCIADGGCVCVVHPGHGTKRDGTLHASDLLQELPGGGGAARGSVLCRQFIFWQERPGRRDRPKRVDRLRCGNSCRRLDQRNRTGPGLLLINAPER